MKLFVLNLIETDYDTTIGFVACAESEEKARILVSKSGECMTEGEKAWLDPAKSSCEEVSVDGEPKVILYSKLYG